MTRKAPPPPAPKPKRGRPPLGDRARKASIRVRLTADEKKAFEQAAALDHKDVSEWIRAALQPLLDGSHELVRRDMLAKLLQLEATTVGPASQSMPQKPRRS